MRRVAFAVLSTVAGLVGLLSFKTEATGSTTASSAVVSSGQTTSSGSASPSTAHHTSSNTSRHASTRTSAGSSKPTSKPTSTPTTSTSGTYTGSVVETQYGPVQVRITVTNGSVSSATAVEYPNSDPRSAQINAYAVPYLQQESKGVTSANSVQMISGATYTSEGYLQSLQSALDKAGL